MLNDALLESFIDGFFGYGNYAAPIWFIGMEEGGGNSEAEIEKRIDVWNSRGRCELEDLAEYHWALNITRYFDTPPVLQSTWAKLIRTYLTSMEQPVSKSTVSAYQRSQWGRFQGSTCLLDLMPLPSPNTSNWVYGDLSKIPYLQSREKYVAAAADTRISSIQQRINEYGPRGIVFYGMHYKNYWQRIAGIPLKPVDNASMLHGAHDTITFLVLRHPTSIGITNEYFDKAGKIIGED